MTLLVCGRCPKGESSSGSLARLIRSRAGGSCAGSLTLTVHCLTGCESPSNVAFDGPGKTRVRLSRVEASAIEAILRSAQDYDRSPEPAHLDNWLDPALQGCVSAVVPKRRPTVRAEPRVNAGGGAGGPEKITRKDRPSE